MKKGLLIFLFIFFSAAWSHATELKFLSQVYIDHDQIYLRDLVDATNNLDASLQKKLNTVIVAETPKSGNVSRFSNFAISEILRFNLQSELPSLNVHIPNEIRVQRKTNRITAQEIKDKLASWVQPTCDPCTIKIESLQIQNDGVIDPNLRWELPTTQIMPKGNFNISIDLYNNDNFIKKIFAQGNLHIYKMVPVAKRTLPAGTKVEKTDFVMQNQDVTFAHDSTPLETEVLGCETSQYLAANQVLWKSVLKRRLALMRGAPTQVLLQNEGWQIHFSGIAQDNGYIGDIAKVLNPETKKVITGVVTDQNVVEVKE